ncbi:hypothetical protein GCM10023147_17380 [Tsukamurella soli]|uniref:DUF4334 domain-containing protein n=1 Tax=Tsukamurella soli TaxID=644556 RepID=A0ABP8JFB5_9ACTN
MRAAAYRVNAVRRVGESPAPARVGRAESSSRGEASLGMIDYEGVVTASMVYDGQPVIDHFKRIDDDTVMGVMSGKVSRFATPRFYFYLCSTSAASRELPARLCWLTDRRFARTVGGRLGTLRTWPSTRRF